VARSPPACPLGGAVPGSWACWALVAVGLALAAYATLALARAERMLTEARRNLAGAQALHEEARVLIRGGVTRSEPS
jgi:hypothetical protein